MTRRVPEFGVLIGLIVSLPSFAFAIYATNSVLPSTLTGIALLYPFALYTVLNHADPTRLLPPGPLFASTSVGSALLVLYGLGTGSVAFGVLVALALAVPLGAYYVGSDADHRLLRVDALAGTVVGFGALFLYYGLDAGVLAAAVVVGLAISVPLIAHVVGTERVGWRLPPDSALLAGWLAGLGIVAYGTAVEGEPLLATIDALLLVLSGSLYHHSEGGEAVNPLSTTATVGVCAVASLGGVLVALLVFESIAVGVPIALAPLAGALAYYRLTAMM